MKDDAASDIVRVEPWWIRLFGDWRIGLRVEDGF